MISVLVLGSQGQLGNEICNQLKKLKIQHYFLSRKDCDITDENNLIKIFESIKPSFVINAAAFTDVDGAEIHYQKALDVNYHAVNNLVELSNRFDATLIHFSTDYVFNSIQKCPIKENSKKNPINKYGISKHLGEESIIEKSKKYFIFRISWVYGLKGNNFPKTIINKLKEENTLYVVDDQIGTPTSTNFISEALCKIILNSKFRKMYGVYNLTPCGQTTWHEFAIKILEKLKTIDNQSYKFKDVVPVNSNYYNFKANRPKYSVLDNTKLKKTFKINTYNWSNYFDQFIEEYFNNE